MRKQGSRFAFLAIMACIFLCILAFNFMTPLESDDYSYMLNFQTGEAIKSLGQWMDSGLYHFQIINGRITTNILFAQGMALLGKPVFNIVNTFVYLLFILGLYRLSKNDITWDWKRLMIIHCAVFLAAPVFGVTVLWMIGACNYLWGTTLILYSILPFRDAVVDGDIRPKRGVQVALCTVALFAGNVTENTSLALVCLMACCIVFLLIKKQKIPPFLPVMAGLSLFGYAMLLLSGQTQVRIHMGGMGDYLKNFSDSMGKLLDYGWLLFLLAFLAVLAMRDREMRNRLWLAGFLFACAMIANLAMTIPGYYAQRGAFGWVILLLASCGLLLPALRQIPQVPVWNTALLGLTALFICTYLWAIPQCYDRLRMAQAREKDVIMQYESGQVNTVTFGIMSRTNYDPFCDGNCLGADPTYLPNRCFAKILGVGSVSLSQEVYQGIRSGSMA